jgi:hypothetical protein
MSRTIAYHPIRNSARLVSGALALHRAPPPPDLAPYIDDFWQYEVRPDIPFVPIQVYPHGCLILRFNLWPDGVESVLYGPSLSAEMKGWFVGGVVVCGAAFRAERGYALLGMGLDEIRDLRLDLAHFWPGRMTEVNERLYVARSFRERIGVMCDFLRTILRTDLTVHADFLAAFAGIAEPGAAEPPAVGDDSVSSRTLRRHFVRYTGLSPRQVGRMVRVQRALARLAQVPHTALADLACAEGFSDQAHLSREFKRLLGVGPRAFASVADRLHDPTLPMWQGMRPHEPGRRPPPILSFAGGVR